jgi:hypothetical protein
MTVTDNNDAMRLHVAAEKSPTWNCQLLTPVSPRPQMPPPKRSSTNGRQRNAEPIEVSEAYPKLAARLRIRSGISTACARWCAMTLVVADARRGQSY